MNKFDQNKVTWNNSCHSTVMCEDYSSRMWHLVLQEKLSTFWKNPNPPSSGLYGVTSQKTVTSRK